MRFPLQTLLLLHLVFPTSIHSADSWPVPRGPSREPAPYRYDPAVLRKVPRSFLEDATACVLYAATSHLFESDGTVETTTHEVTRLNGRKGIENLGEFSAINYDPTFQKLTLHLARIHKPDGQVVPIEPRHAHLRDVATDYEVYDTSKQLILSFPKLQVGDVIEVKWTVRGKNPEYDGEFFTRYPFGSLHYPIVLDEFRVRLPRDRKLKWACAHGKVDPRVSTKEKKTTYLWRTYNRQAFPRYDNLAREELRPVVACSTFTTWKQIGQWKKRRRAQCWKSPPNLARLTQTITKGLTTPQARARALTFWVRRNLRYVARGARHDYTPHPPSWVLRNGYGDCKDTSQLLAVMLRQVGIQVELVTLGVWGDGQVLESVPSPWGTHGILLVTIAGKHHWIDTTSSLAGWDLLPRNTRDRLCYVTDQAGNLRLMRTPGLSIDDNRIEQTTTMKIRADGTSVSKRTETTHALAALWRRDDFLDQPVGERRRQVSGDLQDSNSRARLVALSLDEKALKDFDQPVTVQMTFEIPDHFTGQGYLEGSFTDSVVWDKLIGHNLHHDRKVPLVFYAPFVSRHRYLVHLPTAYTLSDLPDEKEIRSRWGSFTLSVKPLGNKQNPRKLELVFETRLEKIRIEPADFAAFRSFREQVYRAYRVWLTLEPVDDVDQAPLLEAVLAREPKDQATAQVLIALYRKAHRLDDARRVLERISQHHPKNASLLSLTAQLARSAEAEEKARRSLVRLFPDNADHALALARFLVTRGKQKEARPLLLKWTKRGNANYRAEAHYQLARSFYRRDQLKETLEHLGLGAKADADTVNTVSAHMLKGQTYEELERPEDAARAYRQALMVHSESAPALEALIRLALKRKDHLTTLRYLRQYSVVAANDVPQLVRIAEFYLHLGRDADALELALQARELTFHEKAQRIIGLVSLKQGDLARAIKHLQKAELDSTVMEALLRAQMLTGNVRELAYLVDRVRRVPSISGDLKTRLTRTHTLLKRRLALARQYPAPVDRESVWKQALDAVVCAEQALDEGASPAVIRGLLRRAFPKGIELAPAYAVRAQLHMKRLYFSLASADANRALALGPREARALYVRGRIRLARAQKGGREDLLQAAKLTRYQNPDILHFLARAEYQASRKKQAQDILQAALEKKPEDEEMQALWKSWQNSE